MNLKKLEMTNFRCFESLSVDLDEQLTVLVAKNGDGKSSVLDAIRIGLWPFVGGFDLARNPGGDSANNISVNDVRAAPKPNSTTRYDQAARYDEMVRKLPCEITLDADIHLPIYNGILGEGESKCPLKWTRSRDSEARSTKTKDKLGVKSLKNQIKFVQDQHRNTDSPEIDLPVIGYYGTGRLWSKKSLTEKKKKHDANFYMRLFGYRDCLDPASSYEHFADWFTWIFEGYDEYLKKQSQKGVLEGASFWKDTIQVVQDATNALLQATGWHSLEYSVRHENSLVLTDDKKGTLKVKQQSDGIRGALAMVGDIAYRCIKLNPHLGLNAAKETRGVVMIDEIEMHLHPAWQQTILGNLIKAFPKIQFIVTTHSPQVISTVSSHQIRILTENRVISADPGTQGAEASRILNEIFGVELRAQNLEIVQKLNRYLELIDDDKWDTEEALKLRQALDEWSRGNEPELIKADIDIRMKEFQRQL